MITEQTQADLTRLESIEATFNELTASYNSGTLTTELYIDELRQLPLQEIAFDEERHQEKHTRLRNLIAHQLLLAENS